MLKRIGFSWQTPPISRSKFWFFCFLVLEEGRYLLAHDLTTDLTGTSAACSASD